MKIVRSLREIPVFASEDEEREWWATHDLAEGLYDQLQSSEAGEALSVPPEKRKNRAAS